MKMKKLFAIALVSVLALPLLAACNTTTEDFTTPATDAETGKALITIVNNTGFEIAVTAIQLQGGGYITPGDAFADHSIADGESKTFQIDAPEDGMGPATVAIKSKNSECGNVFFKNIPGVAPGAAITLTAEYTLDQFGMGEGVATVKNR